MSYLIDQSFFIRDISIPNTGNSAVLERLNAFIAKYEKECLVKILGYELYEKFIDEIADQRMIDLRDGKVFTDLAGVKQKWNGLVEIITPAPTPPDTTPVEQKQSLIAHYIYYFFQEASATHTTGVSTSVSKSEAGTSVSPADKMLNAWNKFSEDVLVMASFLWISKDINGARVYPEFTQNQFLETLRKTRKNSEFGF